MYKPIRAKTIGIANITHSTSENSFFFNLPLSQTGKLLITDKSMIAYWLVFKFKYIYK